MTASQGLQLDGVVLLGRTLDEYLGCFGLRAEELAGASVLDVGGGVSSFTAEANALGIAATAADPIYALPADEIAVRCARDLATVMAQLPAISHQYRWEYYGGLERLSELRRRAYRRFLADYRAHGAARYRPARLPELPFADRAFTHVLVSHLLFLYEEALDLETHRLATRSLARVASREVRIYPLVNLRGERSRYVQTVRDEGEAAGFRVEERAVDFEFLRNASACLVLTR